MEYELTEHAEEVLAERGIRSDWLNRAVESPERIDSDPSDADLEHHLTRIKEYGNRVLRVILNKTSRPVRVVTAYFDRAMKDRL